MLFCYIIFGYNIHYYRYEIEIIYIYESRIRFFKYYEYSYI